jgi:CheY-like chemotaxis protein
LHIAVADIDGGSTRREIVSFPIKNGCFRPWTGGIDCTTEGRLVHCISIATGWNVICRASQRHSNRRWNQRSFKIKDHRLELCTAMPEQIRVLLVDDSVVVLHEMQSILARNQNINIVGMARTQAEAMAAVRECRPDVVLLDVQVDSASGIDLCKIIRRTFPKTAVLFLTACHDAKLLRSAIRAGAQGYVLKSCLDGDVAKYIESVSAGKAVIDPAMTEHVITWIREGVHNPRK